MVFLDEGTYSKSHSIFILRLTCLLILGGARARGSGASLADTSRRFIVIEEIIIGQES